MFIKKIMKLTIKFSTVNIIFLIYTVHLDCYKQLKDLKESGCILDKHFYHENINKYGISGLFNFCSTSDQKYWYKMSDKYETLKRKYETKN